MRNNIRIDEVFDFEFYPLLDPLALLKRGRGENRKKILIAAQTMKADKKEAAFKLLKKILQAVDLKLSEDVFLIELLPTEGFSSVQLKKALDFNQLISFGLPSETFGLHARPQAYQLVHYPHLVFLQAAALPRLQKDQAQKAALWAALQEMFPQTKP